MRVSRKLAGVTGYIAACTLGACLLMISGCSAEIGSEQWCAELKEKPKGDLTANELSDFARHCIFKSEEKIMQ